MSKLFSSLLVYLIIILITSKNKGDSKQPKILL